MADPKSPEEIALKRAELERRVRAGEWLKTGQVAILLGLGRTKVHTLLASGAIGHRKLPGAPIKPQRLCNPQDVLRLLEESQQEIRGIPGSSPVE